MKRLAISILAAAMLAAAASAQSTAFTFQGKLSDGNVPASGTYEMRFVLYKTADGDDPAAAAVSLSGRVTGPGGRGLGGAVLTIAGGGLTEPVSAITTSFGYYRFEGLSAGETYVVSAWHRRYVLEPSARVVTLMDSVADAGFTARQGSSERALQQ